MAGLLSKELIPLPSVSPLYLEDRIKQLEREIDECEQDFKDLTASMRAVGRRYAKELQRSLAAFPMRDALDELYRGTMHSASGSVDAKWVMGVCQRAVRQWDELR